MPERGVCRVDGCDLPRHGRLGYCRFCEAVHLAVLELRRRLLARRGERLRDRHREFFAALDPRHRKELLMHLAAQPPVRGRRLGLDPAGLEDFLAELGEAGFVPEELT